MSKVIRSVKNVTKGYSNVQIKVREATSNDPWGPTGTQMSEIAQMTFNSSTEFYEIMDMIDKRLNDKGKNWRHVLKALKVTDYCLHEGAELVVTWAKQNIFIIKTLREFQYIDEDGRDVGQNVRVAAKELTSLILDEERLRAERSDRKTWKSRVNGLEEYAPQYNQGSRPEPPRQRIRPFNEEEDTEYRLAIEASKHQEEEDRRKRESRNVDDDDDDLAKAIKLSKEEEERRRRELEETNANALFDPEPASASTSQPQFTGFNQGYQQGSAVDFFANPIDQSQMQPQPTGYVNNAYTGFQPQATGYPNGYSNGFAQQQTAFDPFGQQQQQMPQMPQQQSFQPQPTGYNPYMQQQQQQQPQPQQQQFLQPQPQEPGLQPGSNNPWAGNSTPQSLKPTATGSNNPFAQRPSTGYKSQSSMTTLGSLPEQKTLSTFQPQQQQSSSPFSTMQQPQPQFQQQQQPQQQQQLQQPQKELTEHEARLNALLAGGEGLDTFGNTGNLRIPAQHTAPGVFVNSAGAGLNRINPEATGNNPFLKQQFTGMPAVSYPQQQQQHPQMPAATGPAGMGMGMGGGGGGSTNNPFAARGGQQGQQGGDLIQF
jgi:epsin